MKGTLLSTCVTVLYLLVVFNVTYFFWNDVLDFQWLSIPLAVFSTWALTSGGN